MIMKTKRAFITGITGQDGSYLTELLLSKGYTVYGLVRRSSTDPLTRLHPLDTEGKIILRYGDMRDAGTIRQILEEAQPDEIYNLAAQSDVGVSFTCPDETMETNYYGLGRVIQEAVRVNPKVKIYQASTSEMFGKTNPPQNEKSPFAPVSPYGEAKLKAHEDFVRGYRERDGLFICSGILFNHESPRRGEHFVTRKITISLAKIKLGMQNHFELGNLDAKRDWGFAGDYVKAMWMMLQRDTPEDFVISTGESRMVREFVESAAKALDMHVTWEGKGLQEVGKDKNGKIIVKINKNFYRPTDVDYLCGDNTKVKKMLGWQPTVSFDELVKMMVDFDIELLKNRLPVSF